MNRGFRLVAAFTTAVALLFSQLAVSAYACARDVGPALASASIAHDAVQCDEMDGDSPALCHSHCDQGAQSVDKAQAPDIAQPVDSIFVSAWPSGEQLASSLAPASRACPPTGPPG